MLVLTYIKEMLVMKFVEMVSTMVMLSGIILMLMNVMMDLRDLVMVVILYAGLKEDGNVEEALLEFLMYVHQCAGTGELMELSIVMMETRTVAMAVALYVT